MKSTNTAIALCLAICSIRCLAVDISSASDLAAALANDPSGTYMLTADMDLSSTGYAMLSAFNGVIDGNGHVLYWRGSTPLFDDFRGTIKNIVVDGSLDSVNTTMTGTGYGAICKSAHTGTFSGVMVKGYTIRHSTGNVGGSGIGLFAGAAYAGTLFERCATDASCSLTKNGKANAMVGGFVGVATKDESDGVVVTFDSCTNNVSFSVTGDNNSSWGSGGFVGGLTGGKATITRFVFVGCVNKGNITVTGGSVNAGGIVGYICFGNHKEYGNRSYFIDCVNLGSIITTSSCTAIGGIVGQGSSSVSALFDGCANYGSIGTDGKASNAGGLAGCWGVYMSSEANTRDLTFRNCANYGSVDGGSSAGGLCGKISTNIGWATGYFRFLNCASYGTVSATGSWGEMTASLTYNTSATDAGLFDNCWTKTSAIYESAPNKVPTKRNMKTADDADALSDLNGIADSELSYLPWVSGTDGRPELLAFVPSADRRLVVFRDWDGAILKQETVVPGSAATAPADPERAHYSFAGWSASFDGIEENTIIYAEYSPLQYTVEFDSCGGTPCASVTGNVYSLFDLPVPSQSGFVFSGWSLDGVYTDVGAIHDKDITLTALWKAEKEPYVRQLTLLQWNLQNINVSSVSARSTAIAAALGETEPDFCVFSGYTMNATLLQTMMAKIEGYGYAYTGSNGSVDANGRMFFFKSSRFEVFGPASTAMPASNATFAWVPVKEKDTQNIYLLVCGFFNPTKNVKDYLSLSVSTINKLKTNYPTATILFGADLRLADGTSTFISEYGDWKGLEEAISSQWGMQVLRSGDDLQYSFLASPYENNEYNVLSIKQVDNPDNQTNPGYATTFSVGKAGGFVIFVR